MNRVLKGVIWFYVLLTLTLQIQRGEHISNSSRFSRVGGGQRSFRRFSKRQSEDEILQNEIDIDDIETECPRLSQCVPRFFCERFRGRTVFDQIVSN